MTSEKQIDDDLETATSSTSKTDEQEETKSKSNESDNDKTNNNDDHEDDDDDDTSSNASSEYEVEKILGKRKRRRGGGYEYYIKWVGYDDSANEWIPETSLSCPERVAEFERAEAKKLKQSKKERRQSSSSQKKRRSSYTNHQTNRVKKRRVKTIDNDDDDNDDDDDHHHQHNHNHDHDDKKDNKKEEKKEEEEETIPKEPVQSMESSCSSLANLEKESHSTSSITYGVEKGYQVQAILGINRTKGDQLHYLVHYKSPTIFDDNMELIPSNIAKQYCEDEIIQFYETRIAWNERENN